MDGKRSVMRIRCRARALLAGAVVLLAAACDGQDADDLLLPEEHRHANGLAVRPPVGFDMREAPDGFRFREAAMIRSPRLVHVTLIEAPPDLTADGRRQLPGGAMASHATIRLNGGSGGAEYQLILWRPLDDRWLVVEERAQSEWGEPGFAVAWALIDLARAAQQE